MSDYVVYKSEVCRKCKGKGVIDQNIICYPCSGRGRTYEMTNMEQALLETLKKLRWTVKEVNEDIIQVGRFHDLEIDHEQ